MSPSAPDVFLIAFACEPDRGSEPGVGYVFARALERLGRTTGRRVVLVTRPHRVDAVQAALVRDGGAPIEVLPVALPSLLWRATGRRRPRLAAVWWQWRAVRALRRAIDATGRPAVVHHVTFATEALPNFESALRTRAATVFGPGGSSAAGSSDDGLRRRLRRRLARPVLERSDVLVATNEHVARQWRDAGSPAAIVVEPNIVVEPVPPSAVAWDVAVVGVLVPRKRPDLAIRAFALGTAAPARMAVVGDGPLDEPMRELARSLGVADRVHFLGPLERAEVLDVLASSRVLLHASRQEGSPWVVGEAQAAGAHPIAAAGSGADGIVAAAGIGTVVADATPEAFARALRDALASGAARTPSERWSAARLPGMLERWYADAADAAGGRRG